MKVELYNSYCALIREPGDKRISHESTVGYHMKKLLNAQGHKFVRINPSKYGLNSCSVGLADHKAGVYLWHERYAIELAHQAFNQDKCVTFQRVND